MRSPDRAPIGTHVIQGPRGQVANALALAETQGRLIRVRAFYIDQTDPTRVRVVVDVTEAPMRMSRRRKALWGVAAVASAAFTTMVVWVLTDLVAWSLDHIAAVVFWLAIVLAILLVPGHRVTRAAGCCPCHRRR